MANEFVAKKGLIVKNVSAGTTETDIAVFDSDGLIKKRSDLDLQGPTGPIGAQGPQGNQGVAGPTGAQGAQGTAGAAGPTGAQGPQGTAGAAGPTGAQGPQGNQGVAGPTGAQGAQGTAGAAGPTGAQGTAGAAGPTGAQGAQGNQGVAGLIGAQGTAGAAGPTGAQGPQGNQGVAGPTGAQGPQGNQGVAGPTGAQGPQGNQGVAGPTGAQGPQGNAGKDTFFFQYNYDPATGPPSDPGTPDFRLNNGWGNTIGIIYIDDVDYNGAALSSFWPSVEIGTIIHLQSTVSSSVFATLQLTSVTDVSGYTYFNCTQLVKSGTPTSGDLFNITVGVAGGDGLDGDKYATTSTTSNSIGTGSKTFTVETGLAYTAAQSVVIAYDSSNTMEGSVTSYNSGTGSLVVNVSQSTGSGTYALWEVNLAGAPGPAGPQGAAGPTGPAGPAGPQGSQGNQGVQGPTGPAGPAGPQGSQGNQGVAGPTGPAGPAGPQGSQGNQGVAGTTGPAGPAGPQGAQGNQGVAGTTGPAGPAGPQGAQGNQGVQGTTGPAGPAGPAGPQGAQGNQGVAGTTGPAGPAGPTGPAGPAGPQGAQGNQGVAGTTGPAGPAGPQGAQGNQGTTGPTGAQGPQGIIPLTGTTTNGIITYDGDGTGTVESVTISGTTLTTTGKVDANDIEVKNIVLNGFIQPPLASSTYPHICEISPVAGVSLTVGKVYYLVSGGWSLTNAGAASTSTGHIGIAVSTTEVGIRGYFRDTAYTFTTGNILYLKDTNGDIATTAPGSTGDIVRIIGYCINGTARVIYFNPSNDYFEVE